MGCLCCGVIMERTICNPSVSKLMCRTPSEIIWKLDEIFKFSMWKIMIIFLRIGQTTRYNIVNQIPIVYCDQNSNWRKSCYEIVMFIYVFCRLLKYTHGFALNEWLVKTFDDSEGFLQIRRFLELCEIDASVLKCRAEWNVRKVRGSIRQIIFDT